MLYTDFLAEAKRLMFQIVHPDQIIDPVTKKKRLAQRGEYMNAATFRVRMRDWLKSQNYQPRPEEGGTINDLSSERRLNLMSETYVNIARGQIQFLQSQDSDVMEEFPAFEMICLEKTKPQRDWMTRWNSARQKIIKATSATEAKNNNGPFFALKNDFIWMTISRWQLPFPSFDYNDGMWIDDVDHRKANNKGILLTNPMKINWRLFSGEIDIAPIFTEHIEESFL